MTQKQTGRRALALFLAMLMLLSLLPASALAEDLFEEEPSVEEPVEELFYEEQPQEEEQAVLEEETPAEEEAPAEEPAAETEEAAEEALPETEEAPAEPLAEETRAPSLGAESVALSMSDSEKFEVNVNSIELDKNEIGLATGNIDGKITAPTTWTLSATVDPDGATVTWESSDKDVATVDNGVVTAVGAGTATITATAGEKYAECEVTVTELASNNTEETVITINEPTIFSSRLSVIGDLKFIISGEGELYVMGGIDVADGVTLTIEGDGKLEADASSEPNAAGIGSSTSDSAKNGRVVINGTTITASGGEGAPAIGFGNGIVTINGGDVTAYGRTENDPGIGALGDTVNIPLNVVVSVWNDTESAYVEKENAEFIGNHSARQVKAAAITAPRFANIHQVNLSSMIDLEFMLIMDTESVPEQVVFSVSNGDEVHRTYTATEKTQDTEEPHGWWFSCPLNVLELADTVTATYGATSQQYSVMDYISSAKARYESTNPKLCDLLDALQNYGHYMQQTEWTDKDGKGESIAHTTITGTGKTPTDYKTDETMRRILAEKNPDFSQRAAAQLAEIKFALTMNSKTVVTMFCIPASGCNITSPAYETMTVGEKQYCVFNSKAFGPKELGNMTDKAVTIETSGGGTGTFGISPMSYVYMMLKAYSEQAELSEIETAKWYALSAFYDYWKAAIDYNT